MSYPETYLKIIHYSTPARISRTCWSSRLKVYSVNYSV